MATLSKATLSSPSPSSPSSSSQGGQCAAASERGDGRAKQRGGGIVRGWSRREDAVAAAEVWLAAARTNLFPPRGVQGAREQQERKISRRAPPPRPRLRIKFLFPSVRPSVRPSLPHSPTHCLPTSSFPPEEALALPSSPLLPILSAVQSAVLAMAPSLRPSLPCPGSPSFWSTRVAERTRRAAQRLSRTRASLPWLKVGQPSLSLLSSTSLPRTLSRNSFLPSSVTVQERPTDGAVGAAEPSSSRSSPFLRPSQDGRTDQQTKHDSTLSTCALFTAFRKAVLARCILLRLPPSPKGALPQRKRRGTEGAGKGGRETRPS